MKKFLLSLGFIAGALVSNATVYTVFEAPFGEEWAGDGKGYSTTVTVDGKSFELSSSKDASTTNLLNPGTADYSWRIYKSSSITISSNDVVMKGVRLTIDGKTYAKECDLSSGWEGDLSDLVYVLSNEAGSNSVTLTATNAQVRVSKIEVSDELFDGNETPEPPTVTEVSSVKETVAVADGAQIKVNYDLTVAFKSFSNVFACDENGDFIQLYGSNEYNVNDIIPAGWEGKYTLYSGTTPEITPVGTFPAANGTKTFVPKVVNASDITVALVNNVIAVKDVVLSEASPATKDNFTGTSNGTELSLRNNYTLESVPAGTYNMTLLVTVYKDAPSLYVINYDANVSESAVSEIEAENGVAEYYTLQGVKVANPENGLYIVVKNGKASKVIVK